MILSGDRSRSNSMANARDFEGEVPIVHGDRSGSNSLANARGANAEDIETQLKLYRLEHSQRQRREEQLRQGDRSRSNSLANAEGTSVHFYF